MAAALRPQDAASIIDFDSRVTVLQPFSNDLTYAIRVTTFSTAPPTIRDLTNAVAVTGGVVPAGQTNYYRFTVSTNAVQASFELQELTGDVDLFIRAGASLPPRSSSR